MNDDARYEAMKARVEKALADAMDALKSPEPLNGAMRYSLLAGGKRLRPVLLLAACEMAGGDVEEALPFACAVEMIHTYSLIHDDLPAMDDDDFRRGRPTNHKVYGEGIAVLAGDALLSLAFEVMLAASTEKRHIEAMRRVMRGAGTAGMLAGQCMDLHCEREGSGGPKEIAYIHLHKTADMLVGAVGAGLALAGVADARLSAGEAYAEALGIAFQIRDDLLDREGDAALLGKATGMDVARGKLTWPGVCGVEAARAEVAQRTRAAAAALSPFGEAAGFLCELAARLSERER